jgi:hypothetical protein
VVAKRYGTGSGRSHRTKAGFMTSFETLNRKR